MRVGISARTIGVLAVCVLALGAIASVAIGGKKLKTKSEEVEISGAAPPNVDTESVSPHCGEGTKAVSGGFDAEIDTPFGGPGNSAILTHGSLRDGKRNWESSATNLGSNDGDYTGFAYCRKQKNVKAKAKTTDAPGLDPMTGEIELVTAKAKCPQGMKTLSGGFDNPDVDLSPPGQTLVLPGESRKQGKRKWTATGFNAGGQDGEFVSQVVCHKGKKLKTKEVSDTIDATPTTDGTGDILAKCSKKQRVVSGGFVSENPVEAGANTVGLVYASHKQGKRGWNISALATEEDHDFTVFAYCEKKKK